MTTSRTPKNVGGIWANDMRALGLVRGPAGDGDAKVGQVRMCGDADGTGEGVIIWFGGVDGRAGVPCDADALAALDARFDTRWRLSRGGDVESGRTVIVADRGRFPRANTRVCVSWGTNPGV